MALMNVELVINGGSPWGFSISGGKEKNSALEVSKLDTLGTAHKHGLQIGDIILVINGVRVHSRAGALHCIEESGSILRVCVARRLPNPLRGVASDSNLANWPAHQQSLSPAPGVSSSPSSSGFPKPQQSLPPSTAGISSALPLPENQLRYQKQQMSQDGGDSMTRSNSALFDSISSSRTTGSHAPSTTTSGQRARFASRPASTVELPSHLSSPVAVAPVGYVATATPRLQQYGHEKPASPPPLPPRSANPNRRNARLPTPAPIESTQPPPLPPHHARWFSWSNTTVTTVTTAESNGAATPTQQKQQQAPQNHLPRSRAISLIGEAEVRLRHAQGQLPRQRQSERRASSPMSSDSTSSGSTIVDVSIQPQTAEPSSQPYQQTSLRREGGGGVCIQRSLRSPAHQHNGFPGASRAEVRLQRGSVSQQQQRVVHTQTVAPSSLATPTAEVKWGRGNVEGGVPVLRVRRTPLSSHVALSMELLRQQLDGEALNHHKKSNSLKGKQSFDACFELRPSANMVTSQQRYPTVPDKLPLRDIVSADFVTKERAFDFSEPTTPVSNPPPPALTSNSDPAAMASTAPRSPANRLPTANLLGSCGDKGNPTPIDSIDTSSSNGTGGIGGAGIAVVTEATLSRDSYAESLRQKQAEYVRRSSQIRPGYSTFLSPLPFTGAGAPANSPTATTSNKLSPVNPLAPAPSSTSPVHSQRVSVSQHDSLQQTWGSAPPQPPAVPIPYRWSISRMANTGPTTKRATTPTNESKGSGEPGVNNPLYESLTNLSTLEEPKDERSGRLAERRHSTHDDRSLKAASAVVTGDPFKSNFHPDSYINSRPSIRKGYGGVYNKRRLSSSNSIDSSGDRPTSSPTSSGLASSPSIAKSNNSGDRKTSAPQQSGYVGNFCQVEIQDNPSKTSNSGEESKSTTFDLTQVVHRREKSQEEVLLDQQALEIAERLPTDRRLSLPQQTLGRSVEDYLNDALQRLLPPTPSHCPCPGVLASLGGGGDCCLPSLCPVEGGGSDQPHSRQYSLSSDEGYAGGTRAASRSASPEEMESLRQLARCISHRLRCKRAERIEVEGLAAAGEEEGAQLRELLTNAANRLVPGPNDGCSTDSYLTRFDRLRDNLTRVLQLLCKLIHRVHVLDDQMGRLRHQGSLSSAASSASSTLPGTQQQQVSPGGGGEQKEGLGRSGGGLCLGELDEEMGRIRGKRGQLADQIHEAQKLRSSVEDSLSRLLASLEPILTGQQRQRFATYLGQLGSTMFRMQVLDAEIREDQELLQRLEDNLQETV